MTDPKTVAGIGQVGVVTGGHLIALELFVGDGESLKLELEHELLPKLLTLLQTAGGVAQQARSAGPGDPLLGLSRPYIANSWRLGADANYIVAEYHVREGIPVPIAIPRNLVPKLASELQEILKMGVPKKQ